MRLARTYDHELLVHDGAAAVTTSNEGQVGGADKILDLGGANGAMVEGDAIFDVTAIDTTDTNETYSLRVSFSANADGSSPAIEFQLTITAVGRYIIPFRNTVNGVTTYRYGFVRFVNGGTTPSITATAYLARWPK